MDVLQLALIVLIGIISAIFLVGSWMVFFILKDMQKALRKLNEILYGNNLASFKNRSLLSSATEKKSSKQAKTPQKRFFKRG